MNILPTPSEIIAHIETYVQGQEQAKRDLAVAVYNHYLALAYRAETDDKTSDFGRQHILIIGPTGCGKTYLVQTIARLLGVPVSFASATALTEVGYVGQPAESVLRNLVTIADFSPERAQLGIVFIDEIDKIRSNPTSTERDVSGQGVQEDLLTMLDGTTVVLEFKERGISVQLDTSSILFICTGAFSGVDEIVRARTGRSGTQIGFGHSLNSRGGEATASQYEVLRHVTLGDLKEYGFIPEFIGRFATVSVVHALSKEDLIKILVDSKSSILRKQQVLFGIHGIVLSFTADALEAIAEDAIALGTGARALARELMKSLDCVDYRLPELAHTGVSEIVITGDVVRGRSEPELKSFPKKEGDPMDLTDDLRQKVFSNLRSSGTLLSLSPTKSGFTDTKKMRVDEIRAKIEEVKKNSLGWDATTGSARLWWTTFENENSLNLSLVLRLAEELLARDATITEFFLAYVYSGTDNIQANLHYLDYVRLKKRSKDDKNKPPS